MTEAQRLIDILENRRMDDAQEAKHDLEAAAELRRLDAVNAQLLEALQEITVDYADRFDLDCPSTNPGIKFTIKQARKAIKAATGETK